MSEDTHLKVLKIIEENPQVTQRELANALEVSLGKANYCLKALVEKGWVKASNFKNSNKKLAYIYLVTPRGIEEKSKMTVNFLRRKMEEYEMLKVEIEQLKRDIAAG